MKQNRNKRNKKPDDSESTKETPGAPAAAAECEEDTKIPKAFVIKRGNVTTAVKLLVSDWRLLMLPYSSLKLKEQRSNNLLDFISVASIYGVTHLMSFTQTSTAPYWKIARVPAGPSLTFRIHEFSLMRDVRKHQTKSGISKLDFHRSPIVVLKGFRKKTVDSQIVKNEEPVKRNSNSESLDKNRGSSSGSCSSDSPGEGPVPSAGPVPLHLVSLMLGKMFPTININSVAANDCRRVVLFNYNSSTEMIDVRHYGVVKRGLEISKGIQNLIRIGKNPKKIFNKKMIDTVMKLQSKNDGLKLEDEDEDDNNNEDDYNNNAAEDMKEIKVFVKPKLNESARTRRLAVSLVEIGPRMKVSLTKVEEEIFKGKILYHKFVLKSNQELLTLESTEEELRNKRRKLMSRVLG